MYSASRYHDISAGHRVAGHENKCRHLHGHNYRIHFTCVAAGPGDDEWDEQEELDDIGRVIDFGVIKSKLAMWAEEHWDHKFLLWDEDPLWKVHFTTDAVVGTDARITVLDVLADSWVKVPFNPTAENMAQYLVEVVGPAQLKGTGVVLDMVTIEETRKCSATYKRNR